jgi:hypothetical protein
MTYIIGQTRESRKAGWLNLAYLCLINHPEKKSVETLGYCLSSLRD